MRGSLNTFLLFDNSPQHSLVCALASLSEPLLPIPLVVLLLGDLLHLVQKLPHPQLQLGQLLLLSHVGVVDGMLPDLETRITSDTGKSVSLSTHLDVQMNSKLRSAEPLGAVAVQTDHVLPGHVRGEGELALTAVHFGQDDLVVRVSDLNMHPDLWT